MAEPVSSVIKLFFKRREAAIFLTLLTIFIFLSLFAPNFLEVSNLLDICRQVSTLGMIACGMGIVMITGEIDLSVGANYSIVGMITGMMLVAGMNFLASIILGLLAGLLIGFINGFLVVSIGVPSFIATFGMSYVLYGTALLISSGYPVTLGVHNITPQTNPIFFFLGQGKLLGLPMEFVFFVVILIITYLLMHKTIFGKQIFAIGGNANAAHLSGVKVGKRKYTTYLYTGLLAALCGILNLSFIGSMLPTSGSGMEFEVFATIIIGGLSMMGGIGTTFGILVGVLILGIVKNGLVLMSISSFWQTVIIGLVTICAVANDSIIQRSKMHKGA